MNLMQSQFSPSVEKQIDWGDVLPSINFEEECGSLLVPLGQQENGEIIIEDLASISHAIVSGCTGSGKTTFIQTLILIAASRYSSDQFQLAVYDSKYVDYQFMKSIPHLLKPVSTTENTNDSFWDWLYNEEKKRYQLFSASSASDISSFNSVSPKRLPHIFVVIDDVNSFHFSTEIVNKIVNCISIARRVGVHFFVVTSQISSKSMPHDIASSITTRIAFKAITKAESKASIGIYGAESLEIPGEALYKGNSGSLLKLHTVFMPFKEATKTANSFKNSPLVSLANLQELASQLFSKNDDVVQESPFQTLFKKENDPLFEKAASVCVKSGMASVPLLQSHLRIGFMRSIQLLQELEEAGIISASDGVNPRKVLTTQADLDCGDALKTRIKDEYLEESDQLLNEDGKGDSVTNTNSDDSTDDLFNAAVEIVLDAGQVEISMLQRKFKIGYSRAARIIDEMEKSGIIGPQLGALPRQIRITKQEWIRSVNKKTNVVTDDGTCNDDIHLRPFPWTSVSGGRFSVYGDKIHLNKRVMTKLGTGTTSPRIDGNAISSIIFKKATIISKGYFTFGAKSSTPIEYSNELSRTLADVTHDTLSEYLKIEISNKDNAIVTLFLKQLSEDVALPIRYV